MAILAADDPRKVPERRVVTSFCDVCHTLQKVTQFRTGGGKVEWLCDEHKPAPAVLSTWHTPVPNSPPPSDAAKSPLLDQWIEPIEPRDLDADIPADLLEESIDQEIEALASSGELIPTEQSTIPHATPLSED
jgi:hypothetical protein